MGPLDISVARSCTNAKEIAVCDSESEVGLTAGAVIVFPELTIEYTRNAKHPATQVNGRSVAELSVAAINHQGSSSPLYIQRRPAFSGVNSAMTLRIPVTLVTASMSARGPPMSVRVQPG